MWVEKTSHWNLNMSCFLMDMRVTAFFYYPVFTLLTFSLSLTSQSSNIIPIFVSHIPSCRLTRPFLFLFFSSVWRKDGISCKESVYLVCVCVCVLGSGWKEEQGSVKRNNGMLQFASLFVCDLSLPFSLSLYPSPTIPPLPDVFTVECPPFSQAREVSVVPAIYLVLSLSLRALCCAEILIRFFFFSSPDSALIPPQDLLINVLPATVTTAGTDTGISPCMPTQTHASADTQPLPSF